MEDFYRPTNRVKSAVKDVLRLLNLTQKVVAKKAGITPSALSTGLKDEDQRGFREKKWHAIIDFIEQTAKTPAAQARLEDLQKAERAGELLRILRDRDLQRTVRVREQPGSPLTPNAINYIRRPEDEGFLSSFESGGFHSAVLLGGIKMGKTSALYRINAKAQDSGYEGAVVDFASWYDVNDVETLFSRLFGELGFPFSPSGNTSPIEAAHETIIQWIDARLHNAPRAYLMLDSVDDVLLHGRIGPADIREFLGWAATLMRHTQTTARLRDRFALIMATSVRGSSPVFASTWDRQAVRFELNSFVESQVEEHAHLYGLNSEKSGEIMSEFFRSIGAGSLSTSQERDASRPLDMVELLRREMSAVESPGLVDLLLRCFGGHPFLTHFALRRLAAPESQKLADVINEASSLHGAYRDYWRRVQRDLKAYLEDELLSSEESRTPAAKAEIEAEVFKPLLEALASTETTGALPGIVRTWRRPLELLGVVVCRSEIPLFHANASRLELEGTSQR